MMDLATVQIEACAPWREVLRTPAGQRLGTFPFMRLKQTVRR